MLILFVGFYLWVPSTRYENVRLCYVFIIIIKSLWQNEIRDAQREWDEKLRNLFFHVKRCAFLLGTNVFRKQMPRSKIGRDSSKQRTKNRVSEIQESAVCTRVIEILRDQSRKAKIKLAIYFGPKRPKLAYRVAGYCINIPLLSLFEFQLSLTRHHLHSPPPPIVP